jgi:transmembrane 9 superfamily protein 2/4
MYHEDKDAGYTRKRIVEFLIEPFSKNYKKLEKNLDATSFTPDICDVDETDELALSGPEYVPSQKAGGLIVAWTYDISFKPSDIAWASRWDVYLHMDNNIMETDKIHWVSIINSLLIVIFLTGMIALILMRTLHKDFNRYNRVPSDEEKAEAIEESGWKLVHADVFRAPPMPMAFSVIIGTGIQLLCMISTVITFACFGFLSPANRGSLPIAVLVLFVLMGIPAGYTTARLYKAFGGQSWHRATLCVAFAYPGFLFGNFFVANTVLWVDGSDGAVPVGSMFAVLALWVGISVPLCFLGAVRGYKIDSISFPVATSVIPKEIPPQKWYNSTLVAASMGGILPFGAVLVELFFILQSLWMDRVYYVFGFLLLVFLILVLTCIEISIVICYFQLCAEDYRWWWRSMITPGFSAVYMWLYSLWFFYTRRSVAVFASTLIYFIYMFLISSTFFVATGAIGAVSCLLFTRAIYGAIKVD